MRFFNTLGQIARSESVGSVRGAWRHIGWQARKIFDVFPCELPIGSSRLYVDERNSVAALINAMGLYDFNNMTFLQTLLRGSGGVFVDIGANIGAYTLVASEVSSCRVLAIEPHPKAFRLLTENVRRNRRDNVFCLNVALSDHDGWCSLSDGQELAVNHIVPESDPKHVIRTPMRALNSICREMALTPDFIKIDVEGHEPFVLRGLGDLASVAKIMWIEGGERLEVRQAMERAGYLGPYYMHFNRRRLSTSVTRRPEDPIFILQSFFSTLTKGGFAADPRPGKSFTKADRSPFPLPDSEPSSHAAHFSSPRSLSEGSVPFEAERQRAPSASPRVALLMNFIPPYLLKVLSCLSARLENFRILLSVRMEADRAWSPEWGDLNVVVQKTATLRVREWHPQGFTAEVEKHFPYDTLPRLIRYRPDVVISGQLGFRTIQSALYRMLFRRSRLVIWVDASEHTEKRIGGVQTWVRRFLLRRADAVLAVGPSGRRYVERLAVSRARVVEVPYVTESAPFESVLLGRDAAAQRRLIYVGQLIERKGLVPFLSELVAWAEKNPQRKCEFWLVGNGPLRSTLEAMPHPHNLSIKCFGEVPYASLPDLYAQAGIFVLPTLADTWALVVNEALATGTPVLGSLYSQAVEDLIEDGVNGWTYFPNTPEETRRVLDRALSVSADDLAQMRLAARDSVAHLTPDYAARRFLQVIALAQTPSAKHSLDGVESAVEKL